MVFVVIAIVVARGLPALPARYLLLSVSAGLLAIFAYMLFVPLITVSAGWSLELSKLQVFPISNNALFLMEVLLRTTSSPEMLILVAGGFVGLLSRTDVHMWAPLFLIYFVIFSLFVQLALRDFILHAFSRSRFREIISVVFAVIALLPQLLVRYKNPQVVKKYLLLLANGSGTPWHQMAAQSIGQLSFDGMAVTLCWTAMAVIVARRQFVNSLQADESFRAAPIFSRAQNNDKGWIGRFVSYFPDPFGALVEKELRSLVRMPRFRVLFGMACIFSVFVFLPMAARASENSFISQNMLPVTSLYGLLLLSDAVLLNIFGFDRAATQIYFATPIPIATVIKAKNLTAIIFVALQSLAIPLLSFFFRVQFSLFSLASGFLSAAVATVLLLSVGNVISTYAPRPTDPKNSFRRSAGGKIQLWMGFTSLGMFALVGLAFFARWAADRDWVLMATLGFEFAVGLIIYRISLDSAVERANSQREAIVAALSKASSLVSS